MKRFAIAALSLLLVGAIVGPVAAQGDVGPPLGALYLSEEANVQDSSFELFPKFAPTNLYLVADIDFGDIEAGSQNFSNGIKGIEVMVDLPSQFVLTGSSFAVAAVNVVNPPDFIVGFGTVILANTLPAPVITLNMLTTQDIPGPVGELITLSPSSIQSVAGTIIWLEGLTLNGCINAVTSAPTTCKFPFASTEGIRICTTDPCAGLIPVESNSFSTIKASF